MSISPLIAIRATPLLFNAVGVAQYIRTLSQELAKTGENIALFTPYAWNAELTGAPQEAQTAARARSAMLRLLPSPRVLARAMEAAVLAVNSSRRNVALYHEPAALPVPFRGPTVVTVHDLSWVRFPETHPADRVRLLNRTFPRAIERAQHLIAVSDYTKHELTDVYGVDPKRITTTLEAARDVFRPRSADECADELTRHGLRYRGYLLCVGTIEPRKNLEFVIAAYAGMPAAYRREFPLVLVGATGWLASRIEIALRPLVQAGEARPLGYVNDDSLASLYAGARALVYPSLYEGFGLPPLEAMASATPVVVSDRSSLPEVVGSAGDLVAPDDVEGLRTILQRLGEDEAHFAARAAAGLARAAQFSWARCAAETADVYRRVLAAA